MLEKIAQGVTDVEVLAAEAPGVLRRKETQLKEALAGRVEPVYRMLLKQYMDQVRLLRKQYAFQELLAEIGPRASAFASAEQFASWVGGVCPGNQESAGVCYSRRSAKENRYLRRLLCQIASAAVHTKQTFFAGLFARLKPRIEGKGAVWAVAHRMAKVIWLVLHNQVDYREKGSAPPNERTLVRKFNRLLKEFGHLGLDVRALLDQQVATPA